MADSIGMGVTTPNQSPVGAHLTLAFPEVLIDQIADAVAARVGANDRSTQSPWLDVAGAAAYLNMTSDAVRKDAQRGLLPGHQPFGPGSRWFFHRDELDNFAFGNNVIVEAV